MKHGVSGVTPDFDAGAQPDQRAGPPAASLLAARVIADGLDAVADSVAHVLHGASGAARDRATRATRPNPRPPTEADGSTRTGAQVDGRAARWAGHKAARREELIDSAVRAVGQYGPDVSMDQVAAVAGTSKPVIYRYFADKDDLCRAVSQRLVAAGLARLVAATWAARDLREVIAAGVDGYLELLESAPAHYRFINQHPLVVDSKSGALVDFSTVVSELFAQNVRSALAEVGMDPGLAHPWAEGTVGFIRAASLWWLDDPSGRTRAQVGEQLTALLWTGAGGVLSGHAAASKGRDGPD